MSAKTVASNRIYATPMAPLGQSDAPSADDLRRFRAVWAGYGAGGLSWWSWQASSDAAWAGLSEPAPALVIASDPGWPAPDKGSTGEQVIRMQQRLASADPAGSRWTASSPPRRSSRCRRSRPPTAWRRPARPTAATWQALLTVPLRTVDWTAAAG